ncbi:uncharacterized protein BDZ99DRAFT_464375 [Mytilinidion resinicola]|uniref:DUF4139 domain-containing protein n=1 Tax=Mytilinidion resinicola TaxID=574789 RepID=A0A6A6YI40_9PEZI|nr:uncharacterized protein BDZ99DRAFT_464375 [Mytilinidion resinicola]KAF2808506.1 hypothetical protein BDZ99DRAFT_464375 [Mytilinidion resinicola]
MASDIPKQVISIRDLPTKSVILYPSRAHVVRDIHDVILKPGANQVEIYGLTPTVDEHSIQIEGRGAATIVDMTVDLVPNRDIFEEAYPEDSDDSSSESSDEYEDSDDEAEAVQKIAQELKTLRLKVAEAIEEQNSSNKRLEALDRYTKTPAAEHNSPESVSKMLVTYKDDRAKIFEAHTTATQDLVDLRKEIARKESEKLKAGKEGRKQKSKLQKQKDKIQRKKDLQKAEREKEKMHIIQERLRYWPKKVYKVTLQLETASGEMTPSSSRRNSTDTLTLAGKSTVLEPGKENSVTSDTNISLSLSYVTKEASWTPRYDLQISSQQKSATIVYRTEFLNRTGETWKDAKLSFSTSQTSYQGLDDEVPFMHAWRVKLNRYSRNDPDFLSPEEMSKPRKGLGIGSSSFKRSEVFGLNDDYTPYERKKKEKEQAPEIIEARAAPQQSSSAFGPGGPFGSGSNMYSSHGSHFMQSSQVAGQENVAKANVELSRGISMARRRKKSGPASLFASARSVLERGEKMDALSTTEETYDPTIEDSYSVAEPAVEFEESSWEDNGLSSTYDVPGLRTITPSSTTRRHKIASLKASNIHLSHICVPKLRAAAFLRTKIRNPSSSVTLLKGSAGVTLDGSFLGNMTLPRVSPGQVFDLPLGVDPSIHVNYPKPNVHRSTQGLMFNKESAQVYTRSAWLNNTKTTPVEILVLDQVPVSEDERLRIVITTPKGLTKEGDKVAAGVSAKEGSSGSMDVSTNYQAANWGSAVAKLKKNGEVNWTVNLEKGQGCLLKLDYEARLPPAEKIVPA